MNLQYMLLNDKKTENDIKLNNALQRVANTIIENKIKFTEKKIMLGEIGYYQNALPIIPESRDLLSKSHTIVNIRVNWKKQDFGDMTIDEICEKELKLQYGFNISIVDKGYTRNNYKNKENVWVVFNTESTARKYLDIFNRMFRTAIEQDAINEYKRFKQNPSKRVLTYDKLIDNAYELYDMVDRGEV